MPTSLASTVVSLSPLLNFSSFNFAVSPLSLFIKCIVITSKPKANVVQTYPNIWMKTEAEVFPLSFPVVVTTRYLTKNTIRTKNYNTIIMIASVHTTHVATPRSKTVVQVIN